MKKSKKHIIIFILVIAVLSSMIYLIVTDDIALLNPKAMVSNYKLCQKSDYVICIDVTESHRIIDLFSTYIGSDKGYDYYINSLYDGISGEMEEDYFIKKKGKEIVAAFNLKKLNSAQRDSGYSSCGFYYNGYLYFTLEGTTSIFCIDDCLTDCKIYFTPQKFGKIKTTSLCIAEDILYYITDSGSLVKYDGTEEVKIKKLPKIPSIFDDEINKNKSWLIDKEYQYYLNYIDGDFYFGMENKLFHVDEDGNAQYLNFKIPSSSSGNSHIYRIEPYKNNSKLVAVSFFYVDFNPEGRSPGTIRYLINPENGDYIKCKQRANNQYCCLSVNDFWDYVDNLRSLAGNNG
mgnify:CR=1 FL=1